jgi:hypothetical protein
VSSLNDDAANRIVREAADHIMRDRLIFITQHFNLKVGQLLVIEAQAFCNFFDFSMEARENCGEGEIYHTGASPRLCMKGNFCNSIIIDNRAVWGAGEKPCKSGTYCPEGTQASLECPASALCSVPRAPNPIISHSRVFEEFESKLARNLVAGVCFQKVVGELEAALATVATIGRDSGDVSWGTGAAVGGESGSIVAVVSEGSTDGSVVIGAGDGREAEGGRVSVSSGQVYFTDGGDVRLQTGEGRELSGGSSAAIGEGASESGKAHFGSTVGAASSGDVQVSSGDSQDPESDQESISAGSSSRKGGDVMVASGAQGVLTAGTSSGGISGEVGLRSGEGVESGCVLVSSSAGVERSGNIVDGQQGGSVLVAIDTSTGGNGGSFGVVAGEGVSKQAGDVSVQSGFVATASSATAVGSASRPGGGTEGVSVSPGDCETSGRVEIQTGDSTRRTGDLSLKAGAGEQSGNASIEADGVNVDSGRTKVDDTDGVSITATGAVGPGMSIRGVAVTLEAGSLAWEGESVALAGMDEHAVDGGSVQTSASSSVDGRTGGMSVETEDKHQVESASIAVASGGGTVASGSVTVNTGSTSSGDSGAVRLAGGDSLSGKGCDVSIDSGASQGQEGGSIVVATSGAGFGSVGGVRLGTGVSEDGSSGSVDVSSRDSASGGTGGLRLKTRTAGARSGDVVIGAVDASGEGSAGRLLLQGGVSLGTSSSGDVGIVGGDGAAPGGSVAVSSGAGGCIAVASTIGGEVSVIAGVGRDVQIATEAEVIELQAGQGGSSLLLGAGGNANGMDGPLSPLSGAGSESGNTAVMTSESTSRQFHRLSGGASGAASDDAMQGDMQVRGGIVAVETSSASREGPSGTVSVRSGESRGRKSGDVPIGAGDSHPPMGDVVLKAKDVSEPESCGIIPSSTSAGVVANVPRCDGSVGHINQTKGCGFKEYNTVNEQTPISTDIKHFVHSISAFAVLLGISLLIISYVIGANVPESLLLVGLMLTAKCKLMLATNREGEETIECTSCSCSEMGALMIINCINGTATSTCTSVLLCVLLFPHHVYKQ